MPVLSAQVRENQAANAQNRIIADKSRNTPIYTLVMDHHSTQYPRPRISTRLLYAVAIVLVTGALGGCQSDGGKTLNTGGNIGAGIGALLLEPMGWADAGATMGRSVGEAPGYLNSTPEDRASRQAW